MVTTNDHKIIQLNINDIGDIIKFTSEIMKKDFPAYTPEVRRIYAENYFSKNFFEKLFRSGTGCVFSIKNENKIIGIAILKGEYGGVIYVDFLAVAGEYRNNGIGSKLLQYAETWALENKFHYLWLYTESQENIAYYEHRGFHYIGVHRGAWFGADEHILSKQLRHQPFLEVFRNYSKYFE